MAAVIRRPGEQRERLTCHLYSPPEEDSSRRVLERAFELTAESSTLEQRLRKAVRADRLPRRGLEELTLAVEAGVLDPEERKLLERAAAARLEAIQVDDFSEDELIGAAVARPKRPAAA